MNTKSNTHHCPCGSGQQYKTCCGPYLSGEALPDTPEALMRSRYTAYTQSNIVYIQQTMKSSALDNFDAADAREWTSQLEWLGLKVVHTSQDGDKGTVEFIAHFSENGTNRTLHEISEFRRDHGQWYYIKGKRPASMGRNDACPCGSGKKYKKCCGA